MITLSQTLNAALRAGNPQRFLVEFADSNGSYDESVVTRFSNEEISVDAGVHISASFNSGEELEIGSCPSTQIEFSLLNDERQVSNFTFGECKAWLGARIDSGTPTMKTMNFTENGVSRTYEFAPLGVFIVTRPDVVARDIINVTGNDRMTLFDVEMPSKTDLNLAPTTTNPVTILALLQAMCSHVGVTLANTAPDWFLNYGLTFTSWPKQFEGRNMREVLKWIAEAAGSIARFNRSGELEITWYTATGKTFSGRQCADIVPAWYVTAAIDGLKVRNQGETSESSYGTGTNPYVILGNPFLR